MPYCYENDCDQFIDRYADPYYRTDYGEYYCQNCRVPNRNAESQNVGPNIHSYSYRPRPFKSKGNYPSEVLMGIELEMGGDEYSIARMVNEIDPSESHLYCKSDCSISGTEIVTHPMTLKWAREWEGEGMNGNAFDALLSKLRNGNCWTNPCQCGSSECEDGWQCNCNDEYCYTCRARHETGLHIHVSRNAFKQLRKRARGGPELPAENETYEQRIGRQMREMRRAQRAQEAINHQMIWLMFIERNADSITGATKLARRDPNRYAKFKQSDLQELREKAIDSGYHGEDRYMAINCRNDATYELRFFSSTLDSEEFWAALEFADASVEYTRTINANDVLRNRALKWSEFAKWVAERDYPNLTAQINKTSVPEYALV